MSEPRTTVAIVGAGLAGTLVAVRLLERCPHVSRIHLIERTPDAVGRGLAYSNRFRYQPLNVIAAKMSLFVDRPDDFVDWLELRYGRRFHPDDFVSRRIFGDYVTETLRQRRQAQGGERLALVHGEVVDLERPADGRFRLTLATGVTIEAEWVVLALGNSPPSDLPLPNQAFLASPYYVGNPWDESALADLDSRASVAFVGAGLTTIDHVLSLKLAQHQGRIHVLSRRGLLPQVHRPSPARDLAPPGGGRPLTVRRLQRWLRQEVEHARREGQGWRGVVDGMRALTPGLWAGLPVAERRRFLRHARPYWEVHRHRMPPHSALLLGQLRDAGQLDVIAARLVDAEVVGRAARVWFRRRGRSDLESIDVARLVNCTGPECGSRRLDGPLMSRLLATDWLTPDELLLGILTADDGTVVSSHGTRIARLVAIGALRKGTLWESTALHEIRAQAEALVERVAQGAASRPGDEGDVRPQPAEAAAHGARSGINQP